MGALSSKVIWGQLDEDDPSGAGQMAGEPAELEVRITLAEGATPTAWYEAVLLGREGTETLYAHGRTALHVAAANSLPLGLF